VYVDIAVERNESIDIIFCSDVDGEVFVFYLHALWIFHQSGEEEIVEVCAEKPCIGMGIGDGAVDDSFDLELRCSWRVGIFCVLKTISAYC
jgi:hypothetical protein